jgi:2-polyprenyl-3-methyl-5-hydroxy-6-metoxy-1,4-benzoquinol methylase
MRANITDTEWEKFGKDDPYYGVWTDARFSEENLSDDVRAEFFESGKLYMRDIMRRVNELFPDKAEFHRAMDFGCGVGRLAIPLAEYADHVTAIDVSRSMLEEAADNCVRQHVSNVEFALSDDELSAVGKGFDLIHSFIVLQHIPVKRGERILRELLARLAPGGICILHMTYDKTLERHRLVAFLKENIPFVKQFFNWRHGRKIDYPHMQMNDYNLNTVTGMIQRAGAERMHVEFTNHSGALGVIFYFTIA